MVSPFARRASLALAVASLAFGAACGVEEEAAPQSPVTAAAIDEPVGIETALGKFNGDVADAVETEAPGDFVTREPVAPEVMPNVKIFDPRLAQFFSIAPEKLVIPARGNEDLAGVGPGHVLIANTLFMRKVTRADRIGDNFVFETTQAALTDAVKRGDFAMRVVGQRSMDSGKIEFYDEADDIFSPSYDFDRAHALNDVYSRGGLAAVQQNLEGVQESISASGTLAQGSYTQLGYSGKLSYKPNASLSFVPRMVVAGSVDCCDWTDTLIPLPYPYLEAFEFSASGTLALTLGAEFKATGNVTGSAEYTFINYPAGIKPGKPPPVVTIPCFELAGAIGPVPIWADVCFSTSIKAEAAISGELVANASVTFSKTVGGGLVYDRYNGWTRWVNSPPLNVTPTVTFSSSTSFTGGVSLNPKLDVNIYSVAGPNVGISTGISYEAKCEAPELKRSLKWVTSLSAGVAVKPPGFVADALPSLSKLSYSAKLWSPTPYTIWSGTDQCNPAQSYLTYQAVRAKPNDPNNLRTLDLDMLLDVPGPNGIKTLARHSEYPNRVAGSPFVFPFADYAGAEYAGAPEQIYLDRALTGGTYKVWAYDYENHGQANDAFTRARAQVRIVNGANSFGPYTAPGGTYNRWDVASFTSDARGTLSVSTLNRTSTADLFPAP